MATFPANPVVGTTTAVFGSSTHKITTRGWEVQGAAGTPGSVTDVFDAIAKVRGHLSNPFISQLDDEAGEGETVTEDREIVGHSPGKGPWNKGAVWRDPADGKVFVYVEDTNHKRAWVQAN